MKTTLTVLAALITIAGFIFGINHLSDIQSALDSSSGHQQYQPGGSLPQERTEVGSSSGDDDVNNLDSNGRLGVGNEPPGRSDDGTAQPGLEPGAWFDRGLVFVKLENHVEALRCFDSCLKYMPDNGEAWHNRALALYHLKRYAAAVAGYDSAIVCQYDRHHVWCNRGSALLKLGKYEATVKCYDVALELRVSCYLSWHNRAVALQKLGRYAESAASLDSAEKYKEQ